MTAPEKPSYADLEIALLREKQARQESEKILQTKTRDLYDSNQALSLANEKLKKHQRIAIENEKMAALGTLIAGLAHEVNNPLGFAMGNLQVLRQYFRILLQTLASIESDNKQVSTEYINGLIQKKLPRKGVDFIDQDSESLLNETELGLNRVKEIVHSLKNFSRKDEKIRILYDVNSCIKSALTILTNELKSIAEVEVDLSELPKIYCNPNSLTQVFINILTNSVFATHNNSNSLLRILSYFNQGEIVLMFVDNGCGISKENQSKIFDPFFTTKPFGQGTGLGLSICYEKIQELSGAIDVISEVDQGCTIKITLPLESRMEERSKNSLHQGSES